MCDIYPVFRQTTSGLVVGSVVVQCIGSAFLFLLLVVILLGVETGKGDSILIPLQSRRTSEWDQELEYASRLLDERDQDIARYVLRFIDVEFYSNASDSTQYHLLDIQIDGVAGQGCSNHY